MYYSSPRNLLILNSSTHKPPFDLIHYPIPMEHMQSSSFISKLPVIMAAIGEKKSELSGKKQELLEAKRLGVDVELMKQLETQWGVLESDINLLEHTANVMRMDLIQRGLLVNGKV
ncbi:unnamed protein product [Lactuca saligna]|uniref:Uncharacterized protein n=1 Tax=Lactuca saligna TaxID=75948 RepID=A0AA35Z786_LACSI|nr:unnamed protein product [Lactuca saligna]